MGRLKFLGSSVFLLFILLSLFSSNVFANDPPTVGANLSAYQPPTGAQCNINVPSQYTTIQAAVDAAVGGKTICVGPGTYNENVYIAKSIRLSGSGASKSVINGQITNQVPGNWTANIYANNVILEGFLIKSPGGSYPGSTTVVVGDHHSGVIVRYNWVVAGIENGGMALLVNTGQYNGLIQDNVLEGNNSPFVALVETIGDPSDKVDFISNTFIGTVYSTGSDTGKALVNWATSSLIKQNAFHTTGLMSSLVAAVYTSDIVTQNNFNDNALLRVGTYIGQTTLHAEDNWWGDTDPSDNIYGDVDYTPFALNPFPEYPVPVLNVSPIVGTITAPTIPIVVNTSITATANFTDPGIQDTHIASWNWGDGNITTGTVTENNGSGSISDTHTYASAGVYTITLTVTDNGGGIGSSTFQYVSVYNPTPQGLFSSSRIFSDLSTGDRVMFGVSVKYQGTTPTGKVGMNYKTAQLDFVSTSISSLVTSNGMATVRGNGTLNGAPGYIFLVTGIDSGQTGGQAIRFQIKDSSNAVVYDSQPGSSDTAIPLTLVTGQIIVH